MLCPMSWSQLELFPLCFLNPKWYLSLKEVGQKDAEPPTSETALFNKFPSHFSVSQDRGQRSESRGTEGTLTLKLLVKTSPTPGIFQQIFLIPNPNSHTGASIVHWSIHKLQDWLLKNMVSVLFFWWKTSQSKNKNGKSKKPHQREKESSVQP